jgi:hypothetical protein
VLFHSSCCRRYHVSYRVCESIYSVELNLNVLSKEKLRGSAWHLMHGEFLNSVQIELAHGLNSGGINGSQ